MHTGPLWLDLFELAERGVVQLEHDPVQVAYAVLAGISVMYLVYVTRVIGEICRSLGIRALTI